MFTIEKLKAFALLITEQQQARLKEQSMTCDANMKAAVAHITSRHDHFLVSCFAGPHFVVENNRIGGIFAVAKDRYADHRNPYGTLDTTDEWYWGDCQPHLTEKGLDALATKEAEGNQ